MLICCNGYFLGVELKGEHGKPSELQLWNIEKIRKSNGIGFVLYPNQFEEFKKFIEDRELFGKMDEWKQYKED